MLKHSIVKPVFLLSMMVGGYLVFFQSVSGWWLVPVVLLYVLVTVYGSANIRSNYFLHSFSKAQKPGRKIALTFDDGPCENTLRILDLLKQYNAKATFFCIGKKVLPNADVLKRTLAEGHLIGNHSFAHSYHYDVLPTSKVLADIQQCDAVIEKAIGHRPVFFRPPYGVTNPNIAAALKTSGHLSVGWSLRTKDSVADTAEELITKVKVRVRAGDVLLFHDTKPVTAEALAQLLPWLCERFELVQVDELIKSDNL